MLEPSRLLGDKINRAAHGQHRTDELAQLCQTEALARVTLERRSERGVRVVDEQWSAPAGGALLGSSRSVSGGRMVDFEHMLIREEGAGLVFTAKPARQPEASFPAIEIADGVLVFENRAHDFPRRVIYRRGADGRLDARIEGTIDGQPRAVDFPYRRVACPG